MQEASFLGLDAEAAAALAVARRLHGAVAFLPGLLFWMRAERRIAPGAAPAGDALISR